MLIKQQNLTAFFHTSLTDAVRNQHLETNDYTIAYLVNMLSHFSRAENLFVETDDGIQLRPLAQHYFDALQSHSLTEKYRTIQHLGDIALFISALFADSFRRKCIDIDYYAAMGGSAYQYLAELNKTSAYHHAFAHVFAELAKKFIGYADVIAEAVERNSVYTPIDILRQYDIWNKTGSKRAEKLLRMHGINPIQTPVKKH